MTTPTPPVAQLRRMTAEFGLEFYSDLQMQEFLDNATVDSITYMDRAALAIWQEKLARYADMTDVVESGAERKLSQLYKNAVGMVELYTRKVADIASEKDVVVTHTRVSGRSATVWGGVPTRDPVLYGSTGPRA